MSTVHTDTGSATEPAITLSISPNRDYFISSIAGSSTCMGDSVHWNEQSVRVMPWMVLMLPFAEMPMRLRLHTTLAMWMSVNSGMNSCVYEALPSVPTGTST